MKETKSGKIGEYVRNAIFTGKYKPGERIPSETVLCRKFGVTRVTVGKVLAQLVNEGHITRRQGAGSFVSVTDRNKPRTFGLLVPGLGQGEIFEPICNSLAAGLAESNHRLLWGQFLSVSMDERCVQAERLCRSYIDQKVDGVFFAPIELAGHMYEVNERIAGSLATAGIPVVLLDQDVVRFPRRSAFDLVGIDNRRAGFVLASHLVERGSRRIVFVSRPHSAQTVDARIAGYREALLACFGAGGFSGVHVGEPDDGVFVQSLLEKGSRPDAVVCANDYTAAKLIGALLRLGVRVPDDIRVTGVDDLKYAEVLAVPLTTLRQPCAELGYTAAHAMMERVMRPSMPGRDLLVDFTLVCRDSTR